MELKLTKQQYWHLLRATYMADWMANAICDTDMKKDEDIKNIRNYIFSFAKEMGYGDFVDYDEDFYVISRYPFANCFFCGGAGPESVVDLRFKGKTRRYETDERLTFKGVFALNANDIYQMNYILEGAVEFKP
jgi:hypothetical protein